MDEFGQPLQAAPPGDYPQNSASAVPSDAQQGQSQAPVSPAMPGDFPSSIKAGEAIATYNVLESAPYARTRKWAFSMLAAVLVIMAIGFGLDGMNSIPMALAFLVLIVVYTMTVKRSDPTKKVPLIFTTYGMQLAGQFYPYSSMRFFYLVEFPGYKLISIVRNGRFVVGTEIYLSNDEPVQEIREILQEYVLEDLSKKETVVQRLIRLLQL